MTYLDKLKEALNSGDSIDVRHVLLTAFETSNAQYPGAKTFNLMQALEKEAPEESSLIPIMYIRKSTNKIIKALRLLNFSAVFKGESGIIYAQRFEYISDILYEAMALEPDTAEHFVHMFGDFGDKAILSLRTLNVVDHDNNIIGKLEVM